MTTIREVPCNGCYACCQGDAIFLHPECGDKAEDYITEEYDGRLIIAHKENDDCIYLDRSVGCTIYNNRPTICGELDCRKIYKKLKHNKNIHHYMQKGVIAAAKRLKKKGYLK